jgi:hypothetical protein
MKGWKKDQDRIDYNADLNNAILENTLKRTQEEQTESAAFETARDNSTVTGAKVRGLEYLYIERMVADKVLIDFFKTHNVAYEVTIKGKPYEIVAVAKTLLKKDHIFDVKYFTGETTKEWINTIIDDMLALSELYFTDTSHLPFRQIVIVTEKENCSKIKRIVRQCQKHAYLKVRVVQREKIGTFNFLTRK